MKNGNKTTYLAGLWGGFKKITSMMHRTQCLVRVLQWRLYSCIRTCSTAHQHLTRRLTCWQYSSWKFWRASSFPEKTTCLFKFFLKVNINSGGQTSKGMSGLSFLTQITVYPCHRCSSEFLCGGSGGSPLFFTPSLRFKWQTELGFSLTAI